MAVPAGQRFGNRPPEYPLNQLEADTIDDYRSIVLISQYPNVTAFLEFLERNREKAVQLIQLILHR